MFLSADDLARGAVLPHEDVPVPELGDGAVIRVRCLTALELSTYQVGDWDRDPVKKESIYRGDTARGRLLALCCVDESGARLGLDAAAWNAFRADVADRLFEVAQRISGLNAPVEALKKVLGAVQAGASRTT